MNTFFYISKWKHRKTNPIILISLHEADSNTMMWVRVAGSYWARQLLQSLSFMLHTVADLGCLRLSTSLPPCFIPSPSLSSPLLSPSSNCMSNQCSPVQPSTKTFLPHSAPCSRFFFFSFGSLSYRHTTTTTTPLVYLSSFAIVFPCSHSFLALYPCPLLSPVFSRLWFSYAVLAQQFCLLCPFPGVDNSHSSVSIYLQPVHLLVCVCPFRTLMSLHKSCCLS